MHSGLVSCSLPDLLTLSSPTSDQCPAVMHLMAPSLNGLREDSHQAEIEITFLFKKFYFSAAYFLAAVWYTRPQWTGLNFWMISFFFSSTKAFKEVEKLVLRNQQVRCCSCNRSETEALRRHTGWKIIVPSTLKCRFCLWLFRED